MPSNSDSGEDLSSPTPPARTADREQPVEATTTRPGPSAASPPVGLGVLAIVVLIPTTIAVWAQATVFDSEKVASIVGDALAEPEVSAALADYVAEQVFAAVDVEAVVSEVLPDQLAAIGARDRGRCPNCRGSRADGCDVGPGCSTGDHRGRRTTPIGAPCSCSKVTALSTGSRSSTAR